MDQKREFLRGMAAGLAGDSLPGIPAELESAIAPFWAAGPPEIDLIEVAVRLGSREAVPVALRRLEDSSTSEAEKTAVLRLLAERRDAGVVGPALTLMRGPASAALRREALAAVQAAGGDDVGAAVLEQATRHDQEWKAACLSVLSARRSWSLLVLDAVDGGQMAPADVPRATVSALQKSVGREHASRIARHWGTINQTPETKRRRLTELAAVLDENPGHAASGREVFGLLCGQCHALHGEGKSLGPDLTGIDRGDRDGLLHAIVDPSASVLPDYMAFELVLKARPGESERTLIGFIQDETANGLIMIDAAGTRTAVATTEIAKLTALPISLMPEGLVDGLSAAQVRDLFAWLQSAPTAKTGP